MGTEREVVTEYGPSGEGEVRELSDRVKVLLNGEVFEFPKDDEESLPRGTLFTGKGLYVALNSDETRFQYVRPFKGTFVGRYSGMVHQEAELPECRGVPSKPRKFTDKKTGKIRKWIDPERLKFTCLIEVTDGQYVGAVYPLPLDYLFV